MPDAPAFPAGAPAPGGAPRQAHTALDDGQHLARGAAANVLVLLASNFRGVFIFLIARLLGEAALGRFGMAFAATELLSKAGMLGFDNSIIPFVTPHAAAGDRAGARRVFRTAVVIAATASGVVAAVAVPAAIGLAATGRMDTFTGGAALMLLALPGIAVARISTGASRAVLSMRNEFYSRGLTETWITIVVFVLAVAAGLTGAAPAVAVAAGSTGAAVVAWWLASRALDARIGAGQAVSVEGARAPLATDAASMVRFSLPIAASSLLTVLVMRVDVLLLGSYVNRAPGVTVEAFGIFCVCAEIAGGLRKVRQVFDPIFAPVAAARALGADRMALRTTVAAPGRWVLAAQLPLVGALALSGGALLSLYGAGFRDGAVWLAVLGLAHGTNTFAGLVETLFMIERPGLNLANAAVTVALQVASALVLIPALGVTGAALSMLIGFAGQGVLRFLEVRHVFGWHWPWRSLVRPCVAFVLAFVPAAAWRMAAGSWAELPAGAVFLLAYAVAWSRLGADPHDRAVWHRLVRRRS